MATQEWMACNVRCQPGGGSRGSVCNWSRGGKPGVHQEHFISVVTLTTWSLCGCNLYGQTVHLQHRFSMPSSCLCHNLCVVNGNSH